MQRKVDQKGTHMSVLGLGKNLFRVGPIGIIVIYLAIMDRLRWALTCKAETLLMRPIFLAKVTKTTMKKKLRAVKYLGE